jgi:hypothetical protein
VLEIRPTSSGVPTALLNGKFLHSPRDPVTEAARATEQMARREPACAVILGFGLGYQTEALLATTESMHIIVFEPEDEVSAELREARDVTAVRASGRLTWCETVPELEESLVNHAAAGFEVLSLQARRGADPELYNQADRALAAFRSRVEINSNTLVRFGRLWVRNLCRNVGALAAGIPVTRLEGIFRGLPGILLAAGPGLDQILHYLPDLSERMVVVAVDTAVRACRDRGVQPDIAVVVDPQYWNARHLDRVDPSTTLLVGESSTHPSVFAHFSAPPVFCSSLFPLGRELESVLGPMGNLGTGGSVSTTAWDLLRLLGCEPVYLAGLDLGFPNGRTHFRGSFFENLAVALGTRLAPAERTLYRYVSSADPHHVDGTDGTPVLTDRRMEIYQAWFARHAAEDKSPPTFMVTAGGVRIDGIDTVEPEGLLALPPLRPTVAQAVAGIKPLSGSEHTLRRTSVRKQMSGLMDGLSPLEEIVRRALTAVDDVETTVRSGGEADFAPLTDIDLEIQSSPGRSVVSFIMQEAISQIRAGFGSANVQEQIDASRQLYAGLLDSVQFHRSAIRRALTEGDANQE